MDDVRTLDAAQRRRRWAAREVRHAHIRHRFDRASASLGVTSRAVADAVRHMAAAYGDTDLAIEIDRMWEDA